eukprot:TRINITY_DN6855_c0_g1_i3.p1 TRINITY_DN6855_c0_g1~~TRINITY_DN6855_c0_g1_i3.p1  ORF type:complete len:143 (+),score=28.28 TRINITY_DN6855_c0_g1_i3:55-483(+)
MTFAPVQFLVRCWRWILSWCMWILRRFSKKQKDEDDSIEEGRASNRVKHRKKSHSDDESNDSWNWGSESAQIERRIRVATVEKVARDSDSDLEQEEPPKALFTPSTHLTSTNLGHRPILGPSTSHAPTSHNHHVMTAVSSSL